MLPVDMLWLKVIDFMVRMMEHVTPLPKPVSALCPPSHLAPAHGWFRDENMTASELEITDIINVRSSE